MAMLPALLTLALFAVVVLGLLMTLFMWAARQLADRDEEDDACWSGWEVCVLCDDSGYAETYHGGIWTGDNVSSTYTICECPCGVDLRREIDARHTASHLPFPLATTPGPLVDKGHHPGRGS